jgi:hypothetical protein
MGFDLTTLSSSPNGGRWRPLEHADRAEEFCFVLKTDSATGGVVKFYNAGAVTHDRRIGSCEKFEVILKYQRISRI